MTKVRMRSILPSWHRKDVPCCVTVQELCAQHAGFSDETDLRFLLPPPSPLLSSVCIRSFVGLFYKLDS